MNLFASLLHGDLWNGNWGSVGRRAGDFRSGRVITAIARSDIAMTMLFGGFGKPFYEAYEEKLADGPGTRATPQVLSSFITY